MEKSCLNCKHHAWPHWTICDCCKTGGVSASGDDAVNDYWEEKDEVSEKMAKRSI